MPDTHSGTSHVSVLVVGGSLSGLSSALFLAAHGVDCLLVEQHPGTSVHPRARLVTARSMELFRSVGLEQQVREAGDPGPIGFVVVDTLSDEHYQPTGDHQDETLAISPTGMRLCDQQLLEPLLLDRARELGADIRFGTALTGFDQDADGVTATVRDKDTGETRTVRCAYLLAADGIRSPVRERLGIGRHGPGAMGRSVSAIFDADLSPVLRGRRAMAVIVKRAGAFLFARGTSDSRLWQLGFPYDEADDSPVALRERTRRLARIAADLPDLDVEVHSAMAWESAALVTDRFREGRVFLVGDSAHAMPPAGGFGGNTGIQDAHNIAWKLAAVLREGADERLLDSYDSERRPVADFTMEQTLARMRQDPKAVDRATVQLGYCYPGPAEGPGTPPGIAEDPFRPSARPGTRAPHVVLRRGGVPLSTLDLFGEGFTLLTGPGGGEWITAAAKVTAADPRVSLAAHRIGYAGLQDPHKAFPDAYRMEADGAVLVRPDGFIGWRAKEAGPDAAGRLAEALARHRGPRTPSGPAGATHLPTA
ncbi:FAD-dependent monooxygenase [Streptomyces sp. NPDC101151]|uniref:FAD-dependent monooxygenase n=1 Tax=Streptomyces sp. NPDC101151 TaxID=3366115 RepID=UPI00381D71A6